MYQDVKGNRGKERYSEKYDIIFCLISSPKLWFNINERRPGDCLCKGRVV